jgi:hypothetical protein
MRSETAFLKHMPRRGLGGNRTRAIASALAGLSCFGVVVLAAQVLPGNNVDQRAYGATCSHIVPLNEYLICRAAQSEGIAGAAIIERHWNDR